MKLRANEEDGLAARADDPVRGSGAGVPWGVKEILVALLVIIAAMVTIFGSLSLVFSALDLTVNGEVERPGARIALVLSQVLLDVVAVGAAALVSLRKYRLSPRAWGLRGERPISIGLCAAALVAAFATLLVYGIVTQALGLDWLDPESNVPEELFEQRAVIPFTVFLIVIVAPLAEELFFRGFVFNGLRGASLAGLLPRGGQPVERGSLWTKVNGVGRPLGVAGAAIISGLMWASIHGQVGLVVPIAVIGVIFSLLLARTGSLWNAIAVHAAFNLIGVIANLGT